MRALKRKICNRLSGTYSPAELKMLTMELLRCLPGLRENDYYLEPELPPSAERDELADRLLDRLAAGEPLQYVTGRTEFCGIRLKCDRRALIPRPETTELVEWIVEDRKDAASLLDIGTGSGCIAVALALKKPHWDVSAWDISVEALSLARDNAADNGAEVSFERHDILNWQTETGLARKYDVIVSNPPYIAMHEAGDMERNVLDYEPHAALFVPDEDPLLFYRAIAGFGLSHLNTGGDIYFEINPLYAVELDRMLNAMGYSITFRDDISGHRRMIRTHLNHE